MSIADEIKAEESQIGVLQSRVDVYKASGQPGRVAPLEEAIARHRERVAELKKVAASDPQPEPVYVFCSGCGGPLLARSGATTCDRCLAK